MDHTKEPWHTLGRGVLGHDMPGVSKHVATCGRIDGPHKDKVAEEMGEANAARIVACVNACVGIPTDELEEHIEDIQEAIREVICEDA